MRKFLFVTALITLTSLLHAQTVRREPLIKVVGKTSALPEGAEFKSGHVLIKQGYKTIFLDSNRVVAVVRSTSRGATGIGGLLTCNCKDGGDGLCFLMVTETKVECSNSTCNECTIKVVVKTPITQAITQKNVTWKKFEWNGK